VMQGNFGAEEQSRLWDLGVERICEKKGFL
jgi:hypothetical protein